MMKERGWKGRREVYPHLGWIPCQPSLCRVSTSTSSQLCLSSFRAHWVSGIFLDIFKCGKVTWLSVAWLSPSEGHASIPGEGTAESLEKERAGNVQERQQRRLGKASALAVQTQGSLSTRRDCCWKGMEHPQHIFSFFNNVVLQNPAVTRREEKGIEHFSINTALLFVITCWYF